MAQVKISDLPAPVAVSDTDVFAVVQGSTTRRVTWATFKAALSLGTAAFATLAASITDNTVGRAIRIGDGGLLSQAAPTLADMNLPTGSGFAWVTSGTLNQITGFPSGSQVINCFASASEIAQLCVSRTSPPHVAVRRMTSGGWQSPVRLLSADNSSGLAILPGPVAAGGPVRVGQYLLTTLPSAANYSGYEIDVTNATGGSKRCRSNGTVWQILNTTTTVS